MISREEIQRRRQRTLQALADLPSPKGLDTAALGTLISRLQQITDQDSAFFRPHCYLACAYLQAGRDAEAVAAFSEAINRDGRLGGDVSLAQSLYSNLAQLHEKAENVARAAAVCTRFLQHFPLSKEAEAIVQQLAQLDNMPPTWFQHFREGCRAQDDRRHYVANTHFARAMQLHRNNAAVLLRYGVSLRALKRNEDALRALEESSHLDPYSRTFIQIGQVQSTLQNQYLEESCYRRALEINPSDALALSLLGIMYHGKGQLTRALELLADSVEIDAEAPWSTRSWELIEEILKATAAGLPAYLNEVIRWQRWASEEDGVAIEYPHWAQVLPAKVTGGLVTFIDEPRRPTYSLQLRLLPPLEEEMLSHQVALECASGGQEMLARPHSMVVSGFPAHIFELRDPRDGGGTFLGYVVREGDMLELCGVSPQGAYSLLRRDFLQSVRTAQLHQRQSVLAGNRQKFEEALAANADDKEAIKGLADILLAAEEHEAALQMYQNLVQKDPQDLDGFHGVGLCLWKLNKLDQAIRFFTRAANMRNDPRTWQLLGLVYEQAKNEDEAVRAFRKALLKDPVNPGTHLALGRCLHSRNQLDLAEKELLEVVRSDSGHPQACMLLGKIYKRLKRPDEALPYLKKAIEAQAGDVVELTLLLGDCYSDLGYPDTAKQVLQLASQQRPDSTELQDALELLARQREPVGGSSGS